MPETAAGRTRAFNLCWCREEAVERFTYLLFISGLCELRRARRDETGTSRITGPEATARGLRQDAGKRHLPQLLGSAVTSLGGIPDEIDGEWDASTRRFRTGSVPRIPCRLVGSGGRNGQS